MNKEQIADELISAIIIKYGFPKIENVCSLLWNRIKKKLNAGLSKQKIENELNNLILSNGDINKDFLKEWDLD